MNQCRCVGQQYPSFASTQASKPTLMPSLLYWATSGKLLNLSGPRVFSCKQFCLALCRACLHFYSHPGSSHPCLPKGAQELCLYKPRGRDLPQTGSGPWPPSSRHTHPLSFWTKYIPTSERDNPTLISAFLPWRGAKKKKNPTGGSGWDGRREEGQYHQVGGSEMWPQGSWL